jgi:enoyl-CoA hydratase/carnithine racemase
VTLNSPDRLNALSMGLVAGLHDTLDELAADSRCRVVILTGAGRGFCSGLDLSEPQVAPSAKDRKGAAASLRTQEFIASLVPKIIRLPQPVIAAVNGPAVGGGMALAAACDVRIASTTALFGVQFIRLAVSGCDIGISYTLPRLIGAARAAELIYTARHFGADEAERIGFVSEVVSDDELLPRAMKIADVLISHSPFALEMTKQVLRANQDAPNVDAAIALENRTQILAGSGGDFEEAVAARAEKRLPYWASNS